MSPTTTVPSLTIAGCRARQERLRARLAARGLDAALVANPRHVHYLTGFWSNAVFAPIALLTSGGTTTLAAPVPPTWDVAAEAIEVYESNRHATLVDDQDVAALSSIEGLLGGLKRIGCDGPIRPWLALHAELVDVSDEFYALRRTKDDDEVALLQFAIDATEACYAWAKGALAAGRTEIELWAGMQRVAAERVGETIGPFGNDFQIGSVGSPPRPRPCQAGEIAIFDLSVVVRGYSSDMCRSFVVGGRPTDVQLAAHARAIDVLAAVEQATLPGARCQTLFDQARAALDGYRGWRFHHHLGHGIGLCGHEAPRLNPYWDDTFAVGDVFTAEPGLYGEELRAGLRIEQDYHLTQTGLRRLTSFPTDLA